MFKHLNIGREISHLILFLISLMFSLQFSQNLANNTFMGIVLGCLFGALEFEKWYASKKVKSDVKNKKHLSTIAWGAVLLILVGLSAMASFSATRVSIMSQSSSVSVSVDREELEGLTISGLEYRLEELDKNIADINSTMDSIHAEKEKMASEDGVWITTTERFEKILNENRDKKEDLLNTRDKILSQIQALNKIEGLENVIASDSIFKVMAEDFGVTDVFMLKMVMLTLIFILEISLFLVTDPLEEDSVVVKRDEREIFTEYVNELYNNGGKKYLVSDNKIASKIGISVGQCKKYRELLASLKLRGNRPIIRKEDNGWVSDVVCQTALTVGLRNLFMEEE